MSVTDPLILLLASLSVAALVTWRLLIGSHHEARHERNHKAKFGHDPEHPVDVVALPRGKYEAVTIRVCNLPCKAVLEKRDAVFLVAEAPPLPLPGCNRSCNCEWVHRPDRRYRAERRQCAGQDHDLDGIQSTIEQRAGQDRRRKRAPYKGYNG